MSFEEMIYEKQAEAREVAGLERQYLEDAEKLWPDLIHLGREAAEYLDSHNVVHTNFFKETTQGELIVPERTETGLYGRRSHYPSRTIPKLAYQHETEGWYLYRSGYAERGYFYYDDTQVGLTVEGLLVELKQREYDIHPGLKYSIQPISGQSMDDEDKVLTGVVPPQRAKILYESGMIPEAVLDLVEGRGPRVIYL